MVTALRIRQPRLGTRKLHHMLGQSLREAGIKAERDVLFDILRSTRLLVRSRRAYHKTTDCHHHFRRHPNLLKVGEGQVVPTGPEQVWVADITSLPAAQPCTYLSLMTEAYSRKIVGYHVPENLQREGVRRALEMALRLRRSSQPLVYHSDRGIQYCSTYYQHLHARHGIRCLMTDGYDCYQNALAERVNGVLKGALLLHRPADLAQARHGQAVRRHLQLRAAAPVPTMQNTR